MSNDVSDLLAFLGASPTPYHAVDSACTRLRAAGFKPLDEVDPWTKLGGGRWYVQQGGSALAAFVVPAQARAFHLVGAHTDSPNLRVKPRGTYEKEGYLQAGVEVYGGALLNSWLDRDLGLAGRLILGGPGQRQQTRLIKIDRPLARVTQLAIHLDREVNEKGLVLNRQEHLAPILGLTAADSVLDLRRLCAREAEVDEAEIMQLDLMLFDVVPPAVGGLDGEFIFSARLDNLAMCHASLTALIATAAAENNVVRMAVLFDHEEVGSQSSTGAGSGFLPRLLERISIALGLSREDHYRAMAASACVSADMAHAVHPNYADRHEKHHKPVINGGPVIKMNAQQRYATSAPTAALFERVCDEAGVPIQRYVHRTDLQCGSTIGPITSTLLGIPTVDVGNPMLSMHSIREMSGTRDAALMSAAMQRFYCTASDW